MKKNNQPKHSRFIYLLSTFVFLIGTASKCGKDNIEPTETELTLPETTQTGANTFGCKINGEVYRPYGNLYYKGISYPSYHTSYGDFWIQTLNLYDFEDNIYIYVYISSGVFQTGIYPGFENDAYPCMVRWVETVTSNGNSGQNGYEYFLDSTQTHYIEITRLDVDNRIVSGLFEFSCYNENLQDTIHITEGRFDVGNVVVQE